MPRFSLHVRKTIRKLLAALAGILVCAFFCLFPAPDALEKAACAAGSSGQIAMRVLGIFFLAVIWWSGQVLQDWLTALVQMLALVQIAGFSFQTAFLGYTNTSVWLIAGAFCLSAAISKAGLFQRISFFFIRRFSPTFRGQVLALLLAGTICAPLLPSTTAKAVFGASIANGIADTLGYAPGSKARCGLFLASYVGFAGVTPAFMSAGVSSYILLGFLPERVTAGMSWGRWLLNASVWLLFVLGGSYAVLCRFFAPEQDASAVSEDLHTKWQTHSKLKKPERICAILLAFAFALWVFGSKLHIEAAVTALAAVVLCFVFGILDGNDLFTAVPWKLFLFLGCVLNIASTFARTGIDIWLTELFAPAFSQLQHPALFLSAVALSVLALRLILISQTASISILLSVLIPAAARFSFSPFLVGFTVLAVQGCWFLPHQNTVQIAALGCMHESVQHRQTAAFCVAFETLSLLGCLCSIPLWSLLGLL